MGSFKVLLVFVTSTCLFEWVLIFVICDELLNFQQHSFCLFVLAFQYGYFSYFAPLSTIKPAAVSCCTFKHLLYFTNFCFNGESWYACYWMLVLLCVLCGLLWFLNFVYLKAARHSFLQACDFYKVLSKSFEKVKYKCVFVDHMFRQDQSGIEIWGKTMG